jgi:hypothetical protein
MSGDLAARGNGFMRRWRTRRGRSTSARHRWWPPCASSTGWRPTCRRCSGRPVSTTSSGRQPASAARHLGAGLLLPWPGPLSAQRTGAGRGDAAARAGRAAARAACLGCRSEISLVLAAVYQALGQADRARAIVEAVCARLGETADFSGLVSRPGLPGRSGASPGAVDQAREWARNFDPGPFQLVYRFFNAPHLTLARVWIAEGSAESREQAGRLLQLLEAELPPGTTSAFCSRYSPCRRCCSMRWATRARPLICSGGPCAGAAGWVHPAVRRSGSGSRQAAEALEPRIQAECALRRPDPRRLQRRLAGDRWSPTSGRRPHPARTEDPQAAGGAAEQRRDFAGAMHLAGDRQAAYAEHLSQTACLESPRSGRQGQDAQHPGRRLTALRGESACRRPGWTRRPARERVLAKALPAVTARPGGGFH